MKARVAYIDIAKSIGMALVILGHMEITGGVYNYLFSFHMPLFIVLSGMVFKREKIWVQLRSLLISFCSFLIILSAVQCLIDRSTEHIIDYLKALVMGAAAPNFRFDPAPAIWFLSALIIVELISYLIGFLGKYRIIPIVLLATAGFIIAPYKEKLIIPWNIDVAFFLVPFFELGQIIRKPADKIPSKKTLWLLLSGIAALAVLIPLSRLNGMVNIYRCQYGNSICLYYINSLIGSAGIILISMAASKMKHAKLLCWSGKNTLVPMVTHQMLIPYVALVVGCLPYFYIVERFWGYKIIELMLLLVICYALAWPVERYCPFLLGKFKKKKAESK